MWERRPLRVCVWFALIVRVLGGYREEPGCGAREKYQTAANLSTISIQSSGLDKLVWSLEVTLRNFKDLLDLKDLLQTSWWSGAHAMTDMPVVLHIDLTPQHFSTSVSDANLMYEFLLGGLKFDRDNNISLRDQELASMRQGRAFTARFNDYVPKTLLSMEKLLESLEGHRKLPQHFQFETLVLGVVYSAYQVHRQKVKEDRQAWGEMLLRLANATLIDLRRENSAPTSVGYY